MNIKFARTIFVAIPLSLSALMNIANAGVIFFEDFGSGQNVPALTTLDNWNVTNGNVDLWNFSGFEGYSLDMDGLFANATIETKTTFDFVPDNIYELSFSFGNNSHAGNILNFTFSDNSIFDETLPTSISGNPDPTTIIRQFSVLSATSAKLIFSELGIPSLGGSIIDNISLSFTPVQAQPLPEQVPEPSTLAIFALGMIGLASRQFKKQS
jgi:hypothetical protein